MKTFTSDFAYRAAERQRKRSMTPAGTFWVAYGVILGVAAMEFVLAVIGAAQ